MGDLNVNLISSLISTQITVRAYSNNHKLFASGPIVAIAIWNGEPRNVGYAVSCGGSLKQ